MKWLRKNIEIVKFLIGHYKRRNGCDIVDRIEGVGYYLTLGVIGCSPKYGDIKEWKMESGKTMTVKLLSYEACSDPYDMVKSSRWQYLGYKNEKLASEMSYKEALEMAGII